jgi:hypothetical protein
MAEQVEKFYGPGPSYDDFASREAILTCKMEEIFHSDSTPVSLSLQRVLCIALKLRRSAYVQSLSIHFQAVSDGKCSMDSVSLPMVWTDEHHFHVVKWLLQEGNDKQPNSQYQKIQRALADAFEVARGGISEADIALATMIESESRSMSVILV